MKPGDLATMIDAALHELVEGLQNDDESAYQACFGELIKVVTSAQVDLFEKSVSKFHDQFTEDQVTDIRFKLIRAWTEWCESMLTRDSKNYPEPSQA